MAGFRDSSGHWWASYSEYILWREVIVPSGVPFLHDQPLRGSGRNPRWVCPDFLSPCDCARHAICWEHMGNYADAGYLRYQAGVKFPWYRLEQGRYFLVVTFSVTPAETARVLALVRALRGNGCERLHEWLGDGSAGQAVSHWEGQLASRARTAFEREMEDPAA